VNADRSVLTAVERVIRRLVLPVAQVLLWLFLFLSLLLGGWVGIGWSVGHWSPVVVTSGSMEPTLSVGDVILVDRDRSDLDAIGQRSVIVYERPGGELVAHRVLSVEENGFTTKGDANEAPDSDVVPIAAVVGDTRLVVPLIGQPAVWADRGDLVPLVAWLVLSTAAIAHVFVLALGRVRRRRARAAAGGERAMPVASQGVRRVRGLVAFLLVAYYALDPSRFAMLEGKGNSLTTVILALSMVLGTNALGSIARRRGRNPRYLPAVELTLDTVLVVMLATLTGASGIGWLLFALPIIEAAVRFRLAGALLHWMALTAIVLSTRIWVSEYAGSTDVLGELQAVLDQLSVLFLVVVPGAHLAEQLIGDIAVQQRATGRAVDRGRLLQQVAEAGREVSRLGGEQIVAIVEGTRGLGFDVVDMVVGMNGTGWQRIGGDAGMLPTAGTTGSGLRPEDLEHAAVVIDRDDDQREFAALSARGLAALVAQTVSEKDGRRVVLRAAVATGGELTPARIDAFQLFAGQATVALRNDELLSEITAIHHELDHQAHHDALTGLPNRVLLLKELTAAVADPDCRPTVLFLDLNGFKPVNDRLGHEAGDALLRLVAARLPGSVPEDSLVARVGGDEFTILLKGSLTQREAEDIAANVYGRVSDPYALDGETVHISTSIGIAFGDDGIDERELVRRADVAMYQAKHATPRVPMMVYRSEFDAAEERRARLLADIEHAIVIEQLEMYYQPIYEPGTPDVLAGFEALVRWTHPVHGPIAPPEIVESARAAGCGHRLTNWVLHRACTDAADWATVTGPDSDPLFLTVNASPEELNGPHLAEAVRAALRTTGLAPEQLFVEISERLIEPHKPGVRATLEAVAAAGVRMLLDDFGQGQTSLTQIQALPIAGIKLDRSLVVQAVRSDRDRIVLTSVVDLCHRLDLVVVAEGIESAQHQQVVCDAHCDLLQGYHLARPLPHSAVLGLLAGEQVAGVGPMPLFGRS